MDNWFEMSKCSNKLEEEVRKICPIIYWFQKTTGKRLYSKEDRKRIYTKIIKQS